MYVIQIYTMACVSICNIELVVIEFAQQMRRFQFSTTFRISKKFSFLCIMVLKYQLWSNYIK